MINLIPKEEKKIMRANFLIRVSVISLFMLASVMFIASVALLPSYFNITVGDNLVKKELEIQKKTPVPTVELEVTTKVEALNKKLQLVESFRQNKFLVSERVINDVILNKMPDIKITNIIYEMKAADKKEIKVSGTAPSRERLFLFRLALESDPAFKEVDLPVSNFVKGSNINFFIILIPA